ncbi:MAG TPA: VCBS repeat-containing protein [Candidatus Thermoplasmatota archaeon]|nr:VCBS repeat-containing protein [Candidatus Thermoplasmatota archaeon]
MRALRALAVTLVLVMLLTALPSPLVVAAETPPGPRGFGDGEAPREILHITTESSGVSYPLEAFDAYKVQFYDVNGDGRLEIVSHNDNNRAYVFDSKTGKVLTELTTGTPKTWAYRETSGIAIGDVRGNGRTALVIGNTIGILTVFEFNPEKSTPDKFVFDRIWKRQLDPSLIPGFTPNGDGPALDGAPAIADVDGDGKMEIFAQSDNGHGQYVFNHDGSFRWGGKGEGNAYPIVTDLNGDKRLEVTFATDGGEIMVYDANTGKLHFNFDARGHGANPGSLPKPPAILDLNKDGRKEIYFGTRTAVDDGSPDWYTRQATMIFGILPRKDLSGADVLWKLQPEWANPMVAMRPTAADVNGDGKLDLLVMDWNTIGHKPGKWERTGDPNLIAIDQTGKVLWHTTTGTYYSSKDIAIANLLGDAAPEIIHVEGNGKWDGYGLRDLSGRSVGWFGVGDWKTSQAPLLVDLDGDGTIEFVTAVMKDSKHCDRPRNAGCRTGALKVFATGKPWDNVYEDGLMWFNEKIDRFTKVGEKPPVPRGNFSFEIDDKAREGGRVSLLLNATKTPTRVALMSDNASAPLVNLTKEGNRWVGDLPEGNLTVVAWTEDHLASKPLDPPAAQNPDGTDGGNNGGAPTEARVPGPAAVLTVGAVLVAALVVRRQRAR